MLIISKVTYSALFEEDQNDNQNQQQQEQQEQKLHDFFEKILGSVEVMGMREKVGGGLGEEWGGGVSEVFVKFLVGLGVVCLVRRRFGINDSHQLVSFIVVLILFLIVFHFLIPPPKPQPGHSHKTRKNPPRTKATTHFT